MGVNLFDKSLERTEGGKKIIKTTQEGWTGTMFGGADKIKQSQIKEELTHKLRSSKNVFKIVAEIDLVREAKVDDLDARVRHWAVQQHDVLRLKNTQTNKQKQQG